VTQPTRVEQYSTLRRQISRRVVAAWQVPVFHLTVGVDTSSIDQARSSSGSVTHSGWLAFACAQALSQHPEINIHVADDGVTVHEEVNLGVVVAVDGGVVVPVLHGAQRLTFHEIEQALRGLLEKARARSLVREDISGATFTISNLGMYGVERFDAILNPPEAAILAVGSSRPVLAEVGGEIRRVSTADFTLTSDHRAIDGVAAARFMATLKRQAESPLPD
jgi:pyruvate dehydrogenase E2 component (dihydrolipoamide acetyltransferase)